MTNPSDPCDLCGLEIGNRPYPLKLRDKTLHFCCDSCQGIYQMINDVEPCEDSETESNSLVETPNTA